VNSNSTWDQNKKKPERIFRSKISGRQCGGRILAESIGAYAASRSDRGTKNANHSFYLSWVESKKRQLMWQATGGSIPRDRKNLENESKVEINRIFPLWFQNHRSARLPTKSYGITISQRKWYWAPLSLVNHPICTLTSADCNQKNNAGKLTFDLPCLKTFASSAGDIIIRINLLRIFLMSVIQSSKSWLLDDFMPLWSRVIGLTSFGLS